MKLQTFYIPTKELILDSDIIAHIDMRFSDTAPKEYIVRELKKEFNQKQGYFFTPEELEQLLSDTYGAGACNIMDKQEYIENSLNNEL